MTSSFIIISLFNIISIFPKFTVNYFLQEPLNEVLSEIDKYNIISSRLNLALKFSRN